MTESQWWASTDPNELMNFLNASDTGTIGRWMRRGVRGIQPLTPRQVHLFSLASHRPLWKWLPPSYRNWIIAAEDAADSPNAMPPPIPTEFDQEWLMDRVLVPHVEAFIQNRVELQRQGDSDAMESIHWIVASLQQQHEFMEQLQKDHPELNGAEVYLREQTIQHAHLIRDMAGNPFRVITFDSRWRTDDVQQIAIRIHEERDYATMPILADALQEAGCESADILEHCRGDVPHARGCWVIEAINHHE